VPRPTEFVPRLHLLPRTLPTVDILLVSLEYNVVVERVLIEILLLAGTQVPADLVMGVDGLVVAVNRPIHLHLLLL
jgi:hypothetical protein